MMKTMELRPYQEAGVQWLLGRRISGLADEAGLGKTVQACVALERIAPSVKHGLVLCPASVVPVWERHLSVWAPSVAERVRVTTYDKTRRGKGSEPSPDVLICDEAHYLKNPTSQRTKVVFSPVGAQGIAHRAGRVWLLSATPAPNHPGEYWPHLYSAGLTKLSYYDFLARYCHMTQTPYGPRVVALRKDTLPELKDMVTRIWLRRLVKDVLNDLPEWEWIPLDLACPSAEDLKAFVAENEWANKLSGVIDRAGSDDDIISALESLGPHLTTLRRLTGTLKVPAITEWLDSFLLSGEKLVVWCIHHDLINALHSWLVGRDIQVVQMTGASGPSHRAESVERFQNDPEVRVFLGQINAGGIGITLTAASAALIVELPWTPADLYQCAKRIHRIGQNRHTRIYVASIAHSIDEAIARVLTRKAQMGAQIGE